MRDTPLNLFQNYDISRLPSLPHILINLLNACMDDNVSFDIISDIISSDASLTARVISAANSPVYGHASQLTSLKHTLMFLGLDTIKSVAITASVQQFFSKYDAHKGQQLASFWEHTLLTALIARSLAELVHYHSPDEAYLAALLHDIGKLVFQLDAEQDYQQLSKQATDTDKLLKLEQEHYQVSHDELGGYLLAEWGLSSFISDAVRYHHAPEEMVKDTHILVKIINLANRASQIEDGQIFGSNIFDLSITVIMDIVQTAREQLLSIAHSMGIDINNQQDFDDKQVELARHVKAIALSKSSNYQPQIDFYSSISHSSQLLFNIKKTCLFIYNNKKSRLSLDYPAENIQIPLESNSIICQSLSQAAITTSFENTELTIIDKQIINMLSSDEIICLPLNKSAIKYGVLVMGVADYKMPALLNNKFQLKLFARQLTQHYIQTQQDLQSKTDIENTIHAEFNLKAREIVHETNNPLSIINNYLQLLSNKLSDDKIINEELRVIQTEIERVGNIILRCTQENTQHDTAQDETDINELITQLTNLYKSSLFISHNIQCELQLNNALPNTNTNTSYLKQIVSNLIKNAVESMEHNGNIFITTNKMNVNGKNFISISIKDNGPGIADNIFSNLYMPVQTTKDNTHSGLGLSIVKSMLDKLQGTITCDTSSKGTEFTLLIPIQ